MWEIAATVFVRILDIAIMIHRGNKGSTLRVLFCIMGVQEASSYVIQFLLGKKSRKASNISNQSFYH